MGYCNMTYVYDISERYCELTRMARKKPAKFILKAVFDGRPLRVLGLKHPKQYRSGLRRREVA